MDKFSVGINNLIQGSNVAASSAQNSFPVANIKDDTLSVYKATSGATTVFIDLGATTLVDFLSLHSLKFTNLVVIGKLDLATVFTSAVYTLADLSGIGEKKSLVVDLVDGGSINNIELVFTGAIAPEIQYAFIGTAVSFGMTAMQPFDISSDAPSVTNGNTIAINNGYLYRKYTVSIADESADTLKAKIRSILLDGYLKPRGMSLTGDSIESDYLLGVFDSGQFGYSLGDNIDGVTGLKKATITIGVSEFNGGNS